MMNAVNCRDEWEPPPCPPLLPSPSHQLHIRLTLLRCSSHKWRETYLIWWDEHKTALSACNSRFVCVCVCVIILYCRKHRWPIAVTWEQQWAEQWVKGRVELGGVVSCVNRIASSFSCWPFAPHWAPYSRRSMDCSQDSRLLSQQGHSTKRRQLNCAAFSLIHSLLFIIITSKHESRVFFNKTI